MRNKALLWLLAFQALGFAAINAYASTSESCFNSETKQTIQVEKDLAAAAGPNKNSGSGQSHLISVEDRPGPIRIPCLGGPSKEPGQAKLHCALRDALYLQTDMKKSFMSADAVIKEYGTSSRKALAPVFAAAKVQYPPKELTLIAFKKEKQLYLFAKDQNGKPEFLKSYPIIGTSGVAGPKLKEGDKQIPEGFYKISGLRPSLVAHMGLGVNYPNAEDCAHALNDKRKNLGGDILIHGSMWSSGCLAMGNPAIHELFVLVHDCGIKNVNLIFSPCNLLITQKPDLDFSKQPSWLPTLYAKIRTQLQEYPFPK